MTITIELPPDVARVITSRAARSGQDPAGYVQQLAARDVRDLSQAPSTRRQTPQERADDFMRWANSHSAAAPPLSDEAVSRESFYADERSGDQGAKAGA